MRPRATAKSKPPKPASVRAYASGALRPSFSSVPRHQFVQPYATSISESCETTGRADLSEVELGGLALRTMSEQLAALRNTYGYAPAACVEVPPWLAKLVAHKRIRAIYCTSRPTRSVIWNYCGGTTYRESIYCLIYLNTIPSRLDSIKTTSRRNARKWLDGVARKRNAKSCFCDAEIVILSLIALEAPERDKACFLSPAPSGASAPRNRVSLLGRLLHI